MKSGHLLLICLIGSLWVSLVRKATAKDTTVCNCQEVLRYIQHKIATDYAGYPTKVTGEGAKKYHALVLALSDQATEKMDVDSCFLLANKQTEFFKDRHLRIKYDWRYEERHPKRIQALNKRLYKQASPLSSVHNKTACRKLGANTLLLTLPSFEGAYKKLIDSLIGVNAGLLQRTPNLVIDLRGNGGGYDYVYQALMPYINSNPYLMYSYEVRVSDDAVQLFREGSENPDLDSATRGFLKRASNILQHAKKDFVNLYGKRVDTIHPREFFEFPKQVAIITDRATMSSAENLVGIARQSQRVTVFGDNTAGGLDYTEVLWLKVAPFPHLQLTIPVQRSTRLPETPLDDTGYAPDVRIPAGADAYEFVGNWLEKGGKQYKSGCLDLTGEKVALKISGSTQ